MALAMNRYPVRAGVSMYDGEGFIAGGDTPLAHAGNVQSTG